MLASFGFHHHLLMSAELITVNLIGFFTLVQQHQEQWAMVGTFIARLNLPLKTRPNRWLQGENRTDLQIDRHVYSISEVLEHSVMPAQPWTIHENSTTVNFVRSLACVISLCIKLDFVFFFDKSRRNMRLKKKDNIWKQISPLMKTQVSFLVFYTKDFLRFP